MSRGERLSRRDWLSRSALGFGQLALAGLLASATMGDGNTASGATDSAANPLAPKPPHYPAKAKRVVFLFMHGGVSHVDSFDPKPKLTEMNGQPLPIAKPKFEFAPTGNLLASPWKFKPYGQSGIEVSDLFPKIGACVDDICVVRSMNGGDQVSHGPALLNINTGSGVFARPCLGAWTLYGLGSENQNLPGFLSLSPSLYHGGTQNYGSAFLPASFQGTRIGDGSTHFKDAKLSGLAPGDDPALQRLQLDMLARRNRRHSDAVGGDPRLEARIASLEMAFRMQAEAPVVFDIARESAATLESYGVGKEPTDEYARQCVLARRCLEAGVRFVQVNFSYPRNYWDAHGDLRNNHTSNAAKVDQPIAALLADLKTRGLLQDTLVVFATEFGRTPAAQGNDGRDHHPHAFSIWMAGGGVRGGTAYGLTDEFGYYVAENKVTMPDFHATILHLLGLDHTKLTFRHAGRDYRLTDVHGQIVQGILA
ncbi:MAG TPA: DUF1501 domain-containing protein [Pirellulaceae bacterium]|nr:DUF1501 domain-containing protein [Pirellulaceae bacterium]